MTRIAIVVSEKAVHVAPSWRFPHCEGDMNVPLASR
jgi:hypothetical protein